VGGHTSRALFGQPLRLAFLHELIGDIAARHRLKREDLIGGP
jgi:hypothetical protein